MNSLRAWAWKRTTSTLLFTLSILVGIGVAYFGVRCSWLEVAGCALIAVCLFVFKRKVSFSASLIVLGVMLGVLHGSIYLSKIHRYDQYYFHKITLTAVAMNDAVYNKHQQLAFDVNNVRALNGTLLVGKIAASGFGVSAVYQGDTVRLTGKLYPSKGSYRARVSYGQISVQKHTSSLTNDARRNFAAGMGSALPEPLASFALGLLVGQRANLPDAVKQDLLMVGLTHIIAVSGYNLTIMLRASKGLLAKRSKHLSTALSLLLIVLFLLVTGNSPSIVRAAIVSTLSIIAAYYGRTFKPLNLIFLAAAITAWANPAYVWGDISWYLSFLAFYGVLVMAPLIAKRLPKRITQSIFGMVAIESLCAELMTLPIILYTFGQMSFVGLAANMLVAVFVPLAMLLSLIAGLAGMFVAFVAGWFAWPARIVLTYMLDVAHMLGMLPHAFVQGVGLSFTYMLLLYGLILALNVLWFKKSSKSVTITDRI